MANEKRLIYADEAIELINGLESLPWEEETEDLVNSLTTVDAVEVVHGRWVSSGCGFDCCSVCRKVYTDGYFTAMGIKPRAQFNYCPNCGAKMDGDNQ